MAKQALVSIVILTCNSESTIKKCIASLKKSDYKNYEILVVDSKSSDKTIAIAKHLGARCVRLKNASIPLAYNTSMDLVKGRYIFIVNGDSTVSSKFIKNAVQKFESDKTIGAITGIRKQERGDNFYTTVYKNRFLRTNKMGDINILRGNYIFRKSAWDKCVSELSLDIIASEEPYISFLIKKGGYKLERIDEISMMHLTPKEKFTILNFLRKNLWYLKGKVRAIKHLGYPLCLKFDNEIYLSFALWFFIISAFFVPVSFLAVPLVFLFNTYFYRKTPKDESAKTKIKLILTEALAAFFRQLIYPYYLLR